MVQGAVTFGVNRRDIRARSRQQRRRGAVAVRARHVQRREPRLVARIGVHRWVRQQQLDDAGIADPRSDVKRSRTAAVSHVSSRAVVQQKLDRLKALLQACSVQR